MEVIKEHLEEEKKRTLRCFISISIYRESVSIGKSMHSIPTTRVKNKSKTYILFGNYRFY